MEAVILVGIQAAEAEQVPAKAIGGTKKRMEWPRSSEGFDELHYVRVNPAGSFLIEEWRDAV